jgi:hypothetical protein
VGEAPTGIGAGRRGAVAVIAMHGGMRARTGDASDVVTDVHMPVIEGSDLEDVGNKNELPDDEQEAFRAMSVESK